jgi:hypothetical protein
MPAFENFKVHGTCRGDGAACWREPENVSRLGFSCENGAEGRQVLFKFGRDGALEP